MTPLPRFAISEPNTRLHKKAPVSPTRKSSFQTSSGKVLQTRPDLGAAGFNLGIVGGVVDEDVHASKARQQLIPNLFDRLPVG